MSEPLNRIRIKIGEHELPMTVTAEQEARLRQAGRILNERIKQFRDEYGLPDQNVLPMVALTAVADQLLAEQERDGGLEGFHERLRHLHELLLTVPTGVGGGVARSGDAAAVRGTSTFTGT